MIPREVPTGRRLALGRRPFGVRDERMWSMARFSVPTRTRSPQPRSAAGVTSDLTALPTAHLHGLWGDPAVIRRTGTPTIGRALVVAARTAESDHRALDLAEACVDLLDRRVAADGTVAHGDGLDAHRHGDAGRSWGTTIEALGCVVRHLGGSGLADRSLVLLGRMVDARSDDPRACAHAVLGAAEVWRARPDDSAAHLLLIDCLAAIPRRPGHGWGWPEPRLVSDSAVLCSALIVGGELGRREATTSAGLAMLAALVRIETGPNGRLSITGTAGRTPTDPSPQWDQHPSEVAALADACIHALTVTRDPNWARHVLRCWAWFTGDNDAGSPLVDLRTGAVHDVLTPTGPSDRAGLAACVAALGTHQNARSASAWLA